MTHELSPAAGVDRTPWYILALLGGYALLAAAGLPQRWTRAVVEGRGHAAAEEADHGDAAEARDHALEAPPLWTIIPFVLLLAAIAVLPLGKSTAHWWENNSHRFLVAIALSAVTLAYYAFVRDAPLAGHWPAHYVVEAPDGSAVNLGFLRAVLGSALLAEYVPFIVLLFSLYTITGGVRITGDLQATPLTNAAFMGVGALLASLIGTTGAAMLLIRPLLETNRERRHVAHTVVFFIFTVCNCGGCLLPIGDPPLFLGYLEGVQFIWTLDLWPEWAFVNGLVLAAYWLADEFYFHRQETARDVKRDITQIRRLRIQGLGVNGPLLAGVVAAVALLDPSKAVPGTDWHPWVFFREAMQLALVAASLKLGSQHVRRANGFTYDAIIEVAALFVGIFICMQPALEILAANGAYLVERFDMGPAKFFWATGVLSSFLDNAPTYLVFFQTARDPELIGNATGGVPEMILVGISLGAVFMGAMTYIGNGPNFMVKAIAEQAGVRMPSFFGYMAYSVLVLLPILALMDWIFLLRP